MMPKPFAQSNCGSRVVLPFHRTLPRAFERCYAADVPCGSDIFATTRWTVVQLAARNDTARAQQALSKLCEAYWYPFYVYVRRRGHGPEDAQDLTQEFFARLLAVQSLANLSPAKGKF